MVVLCPNASLIVVSSVSFDLLRYTRKRWKGAFFKRDTPSTEFRNQIILNLQKIIN
jgi:hypothetical protein